MTRAAPALTVGVTGASGFLGRQLRAHLASRGHRVVGFARGRPAREGEVGWDPVRGTLDAAALSGLDVVVNLAGSSLAEGRWSAARKRELAESRTAGTSLLARRLAEGAGPRVLVSASAVGWYGDRGDEVLDEASVPGTGFLADMARQWEEAAQPAARAGVRVVHPRIGIVMWPGAGALAKLALPFRMFGGGPLGSGRQWWSWLGLHDLLEMFVLAIESPALAGPFNAVAPEPTRQGDLSRALGRALHRPSWLPAPAFALRAVLGREKADEILLASQRVRPGVLERAGFTWRSPALAPELERLFATPRPAVTP